MQQDSSGTAKWTLATLEANTAYYQDHCKDMSLGEALYFMADDIAKDLKVKTGHPHSRQAVLAVLFNRWYVTSAVIPQHGKSLEDIQIKRLADGDEYANTRHNLIQYDLAFGGDGKYLTAQFAQHDARITGIAQATK